MYPNYGGSYQRPASPILVPESSIQGLPSGSPILMIPYAHQPAVNRGPMTAMVDTQQPRYYGLRKVQTPQVQHPYGGQLPGNGRPRSPSLPVSSNTQWQQPVIRSQQALPVQTADTNGDNTGYGYNDNVDGEGYETINFQDSLSKYPFYERCAYAMFYSRDATSSDQQPVNIIMILGDGGDFGFPGGHIEQTDQSVIDGLNRELREEMNIKRKYQLNQNDHLLTLVRHNPPFVEHFYVREVSSIDLADMEKRVPGGSRWGTEIFGIIRVPLFVEQDGFRGFPRFLSNMFIRNSRSLLIEGIKLRQLMHPKQLKELVRASDRYLKNKPKK